MSRHKIAAIRVSLAMLAFGCAIAIAPSQVLATRAALADGDGRVRNEYAKLPVAFVENVGQTDAPVRYYAHGSRYGFYFTQQEVVLALSRENADEGVALALRFIGSNPRARIEGVDRAPGEVN